MKLPEDYDVRYLVASVAIMIKYDVIIISELLSHETLAGNFRGFYEVLFITLVENNDLNCNEISYLKVL
jgi:hypothetical protein